MKNKLAALILVACASTAAHATSTFTGVAFLNVPGISVGDVGYFLIDTTDSGSTGFDTFTSITANADLFAASSYGDGGYVIVGSKVAAAAGSNITLAGGFANISYTNGISQGDRFAFVTFNTSTTTAVAGDSFSIWTDPTWVMPADPSTLSFQASVTTGVKQLGASAVPTLTGTVIPEPSSFAALAGLAVVGMAATRRRRSA